MQNQQLDQTDFIILWYIVLTFLMFFLLSSKWYEYFVLHRKQRELEDRLEKVEKNSLFWARYNSHRISELEHGTGLHQK